MWRLGLTPFKNKYSNNIEFLTLQEILQTSNIEDWSNKFDSVDSEKYIYGNYAQQNNFTYKYNDDESDYKDGFLTIDNVNLEDSKDVIQSKIYAPDKIPSNVFEKETNVYRLWNKEPKDDGTVNYKSLDKRFYFMRSDLYEFNTPVTIGSETLTTEQEIYFAPFESFFKLPFDDIINDFYLPIYQILNQSQLLNVRVFLNEFDIENVDFRKLYYFKQLGNYYLLNKINNFTERGLTSCEFIRVKYSPIIQQSEEDTDIYITITSFEAGNIFYTSPNATDIITVEYSTDGIVWLAGYHYGNSPVTGYGFLVSGNFIRFSVNTPEYKIVSNTFEIP